MHLGRRSPDREATRWNWRLRIAELLLLPAGYWLYAVIRDREGRAQSPADFARAQGHAEHLIRLERDVGLAWERGVQEVFLHSSALMRALDSFWSYGYLVVTTSVILVGLCQRRTLYRRLRNTFALSTGVAIGVFALFPTVPPRLLPPSYGMIDTWASLGGIAARTPPRIERLSDPFASFPSLHVAWATWCVVAVASMTHRRWVRTVSVGYLALTVVAVVATGNHYVIDCFLGVALTAASLAAAVTLERGSFRSVISTGHAVVASNPALKGAPPEPVAPPPAAAGVLAVSGPVGAPRRAPRVTAPRVVVLPPDPDGPKEPDGPPDGADQGLETSTALTA